MNFIEQSYTLTLVNGEGVPCDQEVDGVVAENTGLGYHYTLDERGDEIYVPTHIPSGYAMGTRFYHEDDAKAYIERVAPLADWQNLTAKGVYELPADLKKKVGQAVFDVCDGDIQYRVSIRPKGQTKFLYEQSKKKAGIEA